MDEATDDGALVVASLNGDHAAFARLVEAHRRPLMAHLGRLVGPIAAEDVAQEALLKVWRALDLFDIERSFRTWLLVIASREAFRHRRVQAPHRLPTLQECDWDPSVEAAPDRAVMAHERQHEQSSALEAALAALPMKARALYELRYRQELPVAAIAEELGVSEGALKVRLHRLRIRLSELINEEKGHED